MVSSGGGGGGVYVVKESGIELQHDDSREAGGDSSPTSPEIFLDRFQKNLQIRILERPTEHELVFELVRADVSLANALRRILLAEVPTVALEHVYMWNNSSIVHDEVLAHRLGLVPLDLDARLLDEPSGGDGGDDDGGDGDDGGGGDEAPTDRNTVVFRLAVSCPPRPGGGAADKQTGDNENADNDDDDDEDDETVRRDGDLEEAAAEAAAAVAGINISGASGGQQQQKQPQQRKFRYPRDRPYTKHVYSSDLVWVPQGDQIERFTGFLGRDAEAAIRPIHDDILIAKLRPGQSIELEAHGRRGIGKDHAKFSPVATASYRLMPKIELVEPVYDELADELVHVYEPGVFELVSTDPDDGDPPHASRKARVCNPYACTMSRNYTRHPQLAKSIKMSRIADHFIFSVESVGMYSPGVLVAEALRLLQKKCVHAMDLADDATARSKSDA